MKNWYANLTTYRFWRPTLLAAAIGACVIVACAVVQRAGSPDASRGIRQSGTFSSLTLPNKSLKPADVIRAQIEALRDSNSPGVGALQCYCLAAPSNRVVTGPLERFARMTRAEPFDRLGNSVTYSIGTEEYDGIYARSLVVTIDSDRHLTVFAWVLEKHAQPPFEDCWLTVGVFPVYESERPSVEPETDGDFAGV